MPEECQDVIDQFGGKGQKMTLIRCPDGSRIWICNTWSVMTSGYRLSECWILFGTRVPRMYWPYVVCT